MGYSLEPLIEPVVKGSIRFRYRIARLFPTEKEPAGATVFLFKDNDNAAQESLRKLQTYAPVVA